MDDLVFQLQNVKFSYLGKFSALCGIDMEIKRGEKLAILGANGTGKTTLLEILDGLIFTDSGSVKFFGREINQQAFNDDFSRYFRSKVGLVFQNPEVQLFCPTVKEDIVFGPLQLGVPKEEIKKRLDRLVDIFDIEELLERMPHQLSMGEKRKVALASTLAIEPEVLILDEPTAGLDPHTARHIVDIIIQANAGGKTIITATHDLHIIEEISDIVYVLNKDRRIARSGSPCELLSDPDFLEENNLIHVHRHRHKDKVHTHHHYHIDHHLEE